MLFLKAHYVLLNVSVVDGYGGYPTENMFVEVCKNEIAAVDSMKAYQKKPDVQEVDLSGYYVMPGLIDAHVHLAGGRGDYVYGETEVLAEPKLVRAMRSVYEAQRILKRGFTSVRDISWNGLYLKRIFGEGILPGPRVIACGPGLTRTGGHADLFQYTEAYVREQHFWGVLADGCEEIRKSVRRNLREGADQIKIWVSGGDNWANDLNTDVHYTFEEVKTCVDEAHMIKGTLVCAHAENNEAINIAIDAGVDTIEHGEDLDEETVEKMVEKGIILVPTLGMLVNWFTDMMATDEEAEKMIRPDVFLHRTVDEKKDEAYQKRVVQRTIDSFRLAMEKGVKIALGSDTVYEPLTPYGEFSALELKEMVKCGMTVPAVIKAATLTAAEALGMAHRIGTVEAGKNADLLVVKKDPTSSVEVLYNPENIQLIILNGRLAVEEGRFAY
ncbi:MAG TPA: amidohydrolase family protein [Clostridiales bacterium]|nr:amidohydrolase family protein [Clostridiales bacterium]